MDLGTDIRQRYLDFAIFADGESPCFAAWARGVAEDEELQRWLSDLPVIKQQPNLVFAAARWHGAEAPGPFERLKELLLERELEVKATIMERATQTNEVGRLATLVPAFGLVGGPLALLEVGASAGLCLHPDRFDYRWSGVGELAGSGGPTLTAAASGPLPVPPRHPDVRWRGGIDLNPLDVDDEDAMRWLVTLVWPEQEERRRRLTEAVAVARRDPVDIRQGDLLDLLPAAVAEAGAHGTPVVFHSAVITYLDEPGRARFHDLMTGLVADGACRWVSNEGPRVLPRVTGTLAVPDARFVLALDGEPVAFTHGHGDTIDWL